ncbi:MAG: APC family permease [Gemmatimonadaceae bacterium]
MAVRTPHEAPAALTPSAASPPVTALADEPDALPRRLGLVATTAIVVGTIIGSGIFRVPGVVANAVGTPAAVAVVWVLGGVITLCGALAVAELAAAFPRSGGLFVYLNEAYGPLVAFLFGWTMLFLGPAALGALALVFAEYLGTIVPLPPAGVRVVAALLILAVSSVAYRSVRGMGGLVSAASGAKVAAILTLVLAAFLLGSGDAGSFGRGAPLAADARWGGVALALVPALWAYNGFQDSMSLAGEVRDPGRVLPRALLAGVAVVVALYLAANAAYLHVLPFAVLRASPLVASDTMVRVVGTAGAGAVAAMVMLSTFGAVAGLALANPRIFYAMADAGLLFAPLARVHPRHRTPHMAVAAHAAVALACVGSRTFEQLTAAFVLGVFPFLALTVAGVMVLRRTRRDLPRPYLTPGYPVVPLVFVIGTAWVIGSALVARPVTTLAGMGLTLLGVPVYWAWQRVARGQARSQPLRSRG